MDFDPVDVDTEVYLTLRMAMAFTRRSKPTILRWVKQGSVRTTVQDGVRGYNRDDLADTEARAHSRQASTRSTEIQTR